MSAEIATGREAFSCCRALSWTTDSSTSAFSANCPDPLEPAMLSMTGDITDHPASVYVAATDRRRRMTGSSTRFSNTTATSCQQQRRFYTRFTPSLPAGLRVTVPSHCQLLRHELNASTASGRLRMCPTRRIVSRLTMPRVQSGSDVRRSPLRIRDSRFGRSGFSST